jgi:hypothetical protein
MNIHISFNWYCDEYDEIPEEHKSELINSAIFRIQTMTEDFYTSGELNHQIESVHYNGY